ncbi:hypothetical protein HNR42_000819 [Deinobacterium chartae]|uniref:Uncharacterized protein n=1 Tax=Deinobacterium chartae TaxID=521158 RepID=A0A841I094_9DEIO|nr:hypothetical protein [Deinobacterium chartae]MBB6097405.1 hypothetical protein [Deinobacterium chartae]
MRPIRVRLFEDQGNMREMDLEEARSIDARFGTLEALLAQLAELADARGLTFEIEVFDTADIRVTPRGMSQGGQANPGDPSPALPPQE